MMMMMMMMNTSAGTPIGKHGCTHTEIDGTVEKIILQCNVHPMGRCRHNKY